MGCLPERHHSSDSSSASDIIHVDLILIIREVLLEQCVMASATNDDILDLVHNRKGHDNKNMLMECVKSKLSQGLNPRKSKIRNFVKRIINYLMFVRDRKSHGIVLIKCIKS